MLCPQCGYMMSVFAVRCPKCHYSSEPGSHLRLKIPIDDPVQPQPPVQKPATPTTPEHPVNDTTACPEATTQRECIARAMEASGWVNLIVDTTIGGIMIATAVVSEKFEDLSERSAIISGLTIIGWGTFVKMLFHHKALFLRVIHCTKNNLAAINRSPSHRH